MRFTVFITMQLFIIVLPFFMVLQNSTLMFEHIGIEPHMAETSSTILFFVYTGGCVAGTFLVSSI
jgi:hypothetical protein